MKLEDLKQPDTEISVIRTILDNPNKGLCEKLKKEDFTFPQNEIFDAIRSLDRRGQLDFPNLLVHLKTSGLHHKVGGNQKLKDMISDGELRLPGPDFELAVDNLKLYRIRRAGYAHGEELKRNSTDLKRSFSLSEHGRKLIEEDLQSGASKPFLEPWTPSQCCDWSMPDDYALAGDYHITRGGIAVIGGVPGCGKSRAAVGLAIAGATQTDWMGMPLHCRFRTLIIQAENGPARLKEEFSDIGEPDGVNLDDWIRVTPQPDFGLPLHDEEFRAELQNHIERFEPGVVVFDPWNRVVMDDRQKDYRAAIDWILSCLPTDPGKKPAVVIVAHLRKQSAGDGRKRGRELLPELSGSGMIGSAARSVFILEHGSPDEDDDSVVWTCAKNNDGREGASSAWHRKNGLFSHADDFDLEEFFAGEIGGRAKIDAADVAEAIGGGVPKKVAVERLIEKTKCKQSAAYSVLAPKGRFFEHIDETDDGLLIWED